MALRVLFPWKKYAQGSYRRLGLIRDVYENELEFLEIIKVADGYVVYGYRATNKSAHPDSANTFDGFKKALRNAEAFSSQEFYLL